MRSTQELTSDSGLTKIHKKATIKSSYVGHDCVDGDRNAWASVKLFEWTTRSDFYTKIKATKCPPHHNNRSLKMAYGTSELEVNVNPLLLSTLKKIHTT